MEVSISTSTSMEANALDGNFHGSRWKHTTSMDFDGSVCKYITSIQVTRSFHGNTWKFPLSVKVKAFIASINSSFHEHSAESSMSFHIPLQLPPTLTSITNFQLLHKNSIRVHRLPLDLLPWTVPPTSMKTSMARPWK